ncbi:TPA: hypothetical protein EYP84_05915, partial [Candidatus Bipolaricaulota bacterium]|nr:hypothetical protein [Candidatus Bipolaricaulota bacterium]
MHQLTKALVIASIVFSITIGNAEVLVMKRVLKPKLGVHANLLKNASFEMGKRIPLPHWAGWKNGYQIDANIAHSGKRSAKCSSAVAMREYGVYQVVELNQREPAPIIAECWSRAQSVSGTPNSGYSLYLDIIYMDDTPLWGQNAPFDCGTHDWQLRRVTVVPEKPIKRVNVYALFRGHTGTVWFDDLRLVELKLPQGAYRFDGIPVVSMMRQPGAPKKMITLRTDDGFAVVLDAETGQVARIKVQDIADASASHFTPGGFLIRDVASESDFRRPIGKVKRTDDGALWSATDDELQLRLMAHYKVMGNCIRIDGEVKDLTGRDRAVTVYFALPLNAIGWWWSRDIRRNERIQVGNEYTNAVHIGVGANGRMSWYPLAAVSYERDGVCIAVPLDVPRLFRIAYNATSRELFCAFDFGLSRDTKKFPARATFSFVLYHFDARWRMRSALQKFYRIFAEAFVKRVEREGIWMPFTDIATVEGFEDFGFAFHEGNNNVPFDDAHGIYSFVYVEPMSHWLPMPKETPRTYDAVIDTLHKDANGVRGDARRRYAVATLTSGIYARDGRLTASIRKAPWCDGALILLNPDPDLPTTDEMPFTKARVMIDAIESAFTAMKRALKGWHGYGRGFEIDDGVKRSGKRSIRCHSDAEGLELGASQTVILNQTEPKPIRVSAWSKAENVTGEPDVNYSIYVDMLYTDGTPHYGLVGKFQTGTHDWERVEFIIRPKKPVARATVHMLFRRTHRGTVWFDDVFLGEVGSERNLIENPSFEAGASGELDGVYLDSLEMGATALNYRREHWQYVDIPLIFDAMRKPCQLMFFATYEFARWLAERMHGRGKLMFANGALLRFPFPAHLLDVMGVEVNWMRGGKYIPASDERMSYWRAMCYRKPYCLLMNTNYAQLTHEFVERYMKRCLFYAIFPSMFDEAADSVDPYWASARKWYNRDRDLFKRYIPLIQALAKAGWEPITHAWTSDEKVYV